MSPSQVVLQLESFKHCNSLPADGSILCPVQAFREYLDVRPSASRHAQFFLTQSGSPLTYDTVRTNLQAQCKALGLRELKLNTHSFRIGRATDLFLAGVSIETIKVWGRWKSDAIYKYLKPLILLLPGAGRTR